MTDDLLRRLATQAGVAPDWTDQTGTVRRVSPESLRAILRAVGLQADTDAAVGEALGMVDSDHGDGARFLICRIGETVSLSLPDARPGRIEATLENGERVILTAASNPRGTVDLVAPDVPGYHALHMPDGDVTLAVAPLRCVTFADLGEGRSGWGLAAQVYSLRSTLDGGIGHFGGVAALAQAAGRHGADALAISPVHALYGAKPDQFSPYSPSTRLFYNPLHADPALVFSQEAIAAAAAELGAADTLARLSAAPTIDWMQATPLRQRLLETLFASFKASPAYGDFRDFAAKASPLLRAHAVFEVLHAEQSRAGAGHWRDWPEAYRSPDNPQVAAFADSHAHAVEYQLFMQWLTGRSYSHAHQAGRDAGMKVGLIADLAIGMDGAGSHAWSRPSEVLIGLTIGAPPDYYAANGQNWGLTTFSPLGLASSGYAPFIETLRASLRHVGGIRIDHVMGMSRLWLIPEGAGALDGAYVTFPSDALFSLIALESWRHRAIVIGEDLGTLPHGFRGYLQAQGVAGMRVLRFERTESGYVPPHAWDPGAVAMTSTHDLVPTAGWWAGSDLEGLDADGVDHQGIRAWDRGVLWGAFRDAGLVAAERPEPEHTDPVVDAAIAYVAATPCTLKIVPIEDALGIRTQPNVPGTTVEKPNWRHRLDGDAAALLDDEAVTRRLRQLDGAG